MEVVFGYLLSAVWNSIDEWRRRRKLAKLKAEILPQFPGSQVCPRCLKVEKRK